MSTLKLDRLTKRYGPENGGVIAVDHLSLDVAEGEFLVLVGPSGCGKSTALRMIAGLEDISDGELTIDGARMNELDPADRDIAMVFQNYALYPHMSVYRNIGYPLHVQRRSRREIEERVLATAKILQLSEYLARRPGELSGGQRQRVAMGRALIRRPKAFLMDEPLSNLDAKLRVKMRAEITAIQRQVGVTTVYVTHDQVEAVTMGHRVAVMRGGILQQVATPAEMFWRPANMFVAGFIGSPPMNLYEASLSRDGETATLTLNGQPLILTQAASEFLHQLRRHDSDRVVVGIRPEHFELAEGAGTNVLQGNLVMAEHLGSETVLHIDLGISPIEVGTAAVGASSDGDASTIARVRTKQTLNPGERVFLKVEVPELRFFDHRTTKALA